MKPPVPVIVLAATDALLRDATVMTALVDAPHVTGIIHDLDENDDGEFSLRRRVFDGTHLSEHSLLTLEHPCAGCALREDAVPAIAEAIARGAQAVVLGLPLGAEILPATRTLLAHAGPDGPLYGIRLGLTVTVCASEAVPQQIADADEALLAHLVGGDILIVDGGSSHPVGSDLIDAWRWPESARYDDLCEAWLPAALLGAHDDLELERRCDPMTVEAGFGLTAARRAGDGALVSDSGAWILDLHSHRPAHPQRLLALGDALAPEGVASRGRFSTPNRPGWVCGWDGIGGSVCVGLAGPGAPGTHIIFAGFGDRQAIAEAFHHALATDAELGMSPTQWERMHDPLARFLTGDSSDAA